MNNKNKKDDQEPRAEDGTPIGNQAPQPSQNPRQHPPVTEVPEGEEIPPGQDFPVENAPREPAQGDVPEKDSQS